MLGIHIGAIFSHFLVMSSHDVPKFQLNVGKSYFYSKSFLFHISDSGDWNLTLNILPRFKEFATF